MNDTTVQAILAILLPLAAALFSGRKPKFGSLGTSEIRPPVSMNGNGANSGLAVAQEAQGVTIKLLVEQMAQMNQTMRQGFDDMILRISGHRQEIDRRLDEHDAAIAALTRRVYLLENPDKASEAS